MPRPPRGALILGQPYFSVKCHECGEVIPLAPNPERSKEIHGQGTLHVTACPFCGKAGEYPANETVTRILEKMPPEVH
jgi:ribosomal protein S27E